MTTPGEDARRFETYAHWVGPGKIHAARFDTEHGQWHPLCRNPARFNRHHGQVIDEPKPLTCRRCIRKTRR